MRLEDGPWRAERSQWCSGKPCHAQRRITRSRMSHMVSVLPRQSLSSPVQHVLSVDGGESVMTTTFLRGLSRAPSRPAMSSRQGCQHLLHGGLTTDCDSFCASFVFATRTAGVASRRVKVAATIKGRQHGQHFDRRRPCWCHVNRASGLFPVDHCCVGTARQQCSTRAAHSV